MALEHVEVVERLERLHELLLVTNGCHDDLPTSSGLADCVR
jgi:hypothetical protein